MHRRLLSRRHGYFRGVSFLLRVRVLSVADLAFRSRAFSSAFPNVSSSLVRESSSPCFLMRKKAQIQTRVSLTCQT
jgi:hypothetical protein